MDPRRIEYGTRVKVQGWTRPFKAADAGGAIKGKRLDIFFWTHEEAQHFGVQRLRVWLPKRRDRLGINEMVDGIGSMAGKAVGGILGGSEK